MITHNNQMMGSTNTNPFSSGKLLIGVVNNREEALMFNVPSGYTAYIFNRFMSEFYVKDNLTGQCSFSDYEYAEKKPIMPEPIQSTNSVTKDDLANMEQRIMQSVSNVLADALRQKGDDGIRG